MGSPLRAGVTYGSASLLAVVMALACLPATASAIVFDRSAITNATLTVTATAGETNGLTASHSTSGAKTYTFTDTGATAVSITGTGAAQCTITDNLPAPVTVTCGDDTAALISTVVVNLGDQNDTFNASAVVANGAEPFTINGEDGNDTLIGTNAAGIDTINGGSDAGMDKLTGGEGSDVLDGGPGIDRAFYSTGNTTLTMNDVADDHDGLGNNTENVRPSVESITGSSGNDNITGSCVGNTLSGLGGDDTLNGDPALCPSGFGGDFLGGGVGKDVILGSATPTASDGVDRATYIANTSAQPTSITLDGTNNDNDGTPGGNQENVGADIEYLYGGPEVDTWNATSALQGVSMWAGQGNDILTGSAFNDYLVGQTGTDTLNCGAGTNDMWKVEADNPASPAPTNCETPVP